MNRRRFLTYGAVAAAGAAAADRVVVTTDAVERTDLELEVPDLPPPLDGLRVAHVTDTHLPRNRVAVERALDILREARPDIVVYTGDIFESGAGLAPAAEFAGAGARGAAAGFVTLGNWEYAARVAAARAERRYAAAGVELLVNAGRTVKLPGGAVNVVGIDDYRYGRPDPTRALDGLDPGLPTIWLVHEPAYVDVMQSAGLPAPALILSGHTHGGQIRLPLVPPLVLPSGSGRFISGWYRDTPGPLYVSRGVGTTVIPVRLFCPPELPIVTLRSPSTTA